MNLQDLLKKLELDQTTNLFFYQKEEWKSMVSKDCQNKFAILQPTAFYLFNQQPLILFFDLTHPHDSAQIKEIHKQVWSFDQAPVLFLIEANQISIYNAFAYSKKESSLEKIELSEADFIEKFSFWQLQSGATWQWLQNKYYIHKKQNQRVHQKLFENIKVVREKLLKYKEQTLSESAANTLILRLIFIRYLIDRSVALPLDGDTKLKKRQNFIELIENPAQLNNFFELLNQKFNGVLFKEVFIPLSEEQVTDLAQIFQGENPEKGAFEFYFDIFDFSIIPVEVISGIYESLIDSNTRKLESAVYTPPFLVEYILKNTIDKKDKPIPVAVLDPSVGSGIFLVQAFRRMVDEWIAVHSRKITQSELNAIAKNNLFGVDINEEALKVACFSIYIAILDYQDPKTILNDCVFPKLLGKNLFQANFLDEKHAFNAVLKAKKMDFILGNPPWGSKKEPIHEGWIKAHEKKIGRLEIAQSFLLRTKDFMASQTVNALLVTSTIFYNTNQTTQQFKQTFLQEYLLDTFFDLSPVRRFIFDEKINPCAIVFYRLNDGIRHEKQVVKHLSLKYNLFLKHYKTLVIEKWDQKEILQKHFIENSWLFKVALYGGALDFLFFKRLKRFRTFNDFAKQHQAIMGAGIEREHKSKSDDNRYYPELIGYPVIDNKRVKIFFTDTENCEKLTQKTVFLGRGRDTRLFKGESCKILFKEQAFEETDIGVSIVKKASVFRKGVFGITFPQEQNTKKLYGYLLSDVLTYYLFLTSCAWGVGTRPAIRFTDELMLCPMAQLTDENLFIDLVNQFITCYEKKDVLGIPVSNPDKYLKQINQLIETAYGINEVERDLIKYTLEVSRYQFQAGKQMKYLRKLNHLDIEGYISIFIEAFQNIYDEYMKVQVYELNHFVAMNFTFQTEKPPQFIEFVQGVTDEKQIFKQLSDHLTLWEIAKNLYIQKDIKGFESHSFYIIKPNEYKCWHRAMARYDVSEFKEAIQAAELEQMTDLQNS